MASKINFALDLTILSAFLLVYNPAITGNTIHEWLGVAFTVALIVHLLMHWKWIAAITTQFFKKLFHQSRLNYIVDLLFYIAMTGSIFSGLMISKVVLSRLGIHLDVSRGWKSIHVLTSDASLILLGIHFALHWKWVVTSIRRMLLKPISRLSHRSKPLADSFQPVSVETEN